jgi:hypothetical protein
MPGLPGKPLRRGGPFLATTVLFTPFPLSRTTFLFWAEAVPADANRPRAATPAARRRLRTVRFLG